jgi:hypothetical protein
MRPRRIVGMWVVVAVVSEEEGARGDERCHRDDAVSAPGWAPAQRRL